MPYVAATPEFGLIVRKPALAENGISKSALLDILENTEVLGEDEGLISFGPLFGEEALEEMMNRLTAHRLNYVDDFFELNLLLPTWARLGVASA
jgi:hypothetical protein